MSEKYGHEAISLRPNSIEQQFAEKVFLIENSDNVSIEFAFDSLRIQSTSSIDFDVMVRASENGIQLGDADIFIRYSTEAFGENVIGEGNAQFTTGKILADSEITPTSIDFANNTVKISVPSDCIGTEVLDEFVVLSQSFEEIIHVSLTIVDVFELASISMDDFYMEGNVLYYDEELEDCIPFDTIILPNPLNPFLIPVITNFFPNPITAGTGDTLTIIGTGFGSKEGEVRFPNADNGGSSMMKADTADVVWSDTLIRVRMPSTDFGALDGKPAGSGVFEVKDSSGTIANSTIPLDLEIRYAVRNRRNNSTGIAVRSHLADDPIGDGIKNSILTFRVHQNVIDSSAMALDIVEMAMCDWTTVTGIQWDLGAVIPSGGIPDSTNAILFSSSGILGNATGTAVTTINVCQDFSQMPAIPYFYNTQFDIFLQANLSALPTPTSSWYFGTAGNPSNKQMDFYSVILHELGHAHNLKHANPKSKLMFYRLLPDSTSRVITVDESDGGIDILNTSSAVLAPLSADCPPAVTTGGSCLTPVREQELLHFGSVILFPNPTTNYLNLSIDNLIGGQTNIIISNTFGHEVLRKDLGFLPSGKFDDKIDLQALSAGIYFLSLEKKEKLFIGKIIKF